MSDAPTQVLRFSGIASFPIILESVRQSDGGMLDTLVIARNSSVSIEINLASSDASASDKTEAVGLSKALQCGFKPRLKIGDDPCP